MSAGRAHDADDDVRAPWDGADAAGHASLVMTRGAFGRFVGLTHLGLGYRNQSLADPPLDAIGDNPYRLVCSFENCVAGPRKL